MKLFPSLLVIFLGLLVLTKVATAGDVERLANCMAAAEAASSSEPPETAVIDGHRSSADVEPVSNAAKTDPPTARRVNDTAQRGKSSESKLQKCFDLE